MIMKKFLSIILALAMILGMSVSFAATTNVNFTNSTGRSFNGYQILILTSSLKGAGHHPSACDGVNHADDCYNFAYTVNAKYRSILQKEVHDNGGNYLWGSGTKPTTPAGITDAHILDYFKNQTPDNGTMRNVADRIYRAIKAASISEDASGLTGATNPINQGYWMFADVSTLTGNEANSLVMVDTAGEINITINPKTALPTLEKKVKDIEDSEDDSITDNPWHDSADHDFNDVVPFKLTATLPENAQSYLEYTLIFHDKIDASLSFDSSSVKVLMYDTKHKADVDVDLNDSAKEVTANFTVKTAGLADDCTFEVVCENIYAIPGVTKDTAFVVYYEATLQNTATIGSAGNLNTAYLEFSNDPYGTGTGKTESDKVKVFTYKLVVNKVDSHGHDLEGAGFTLYKKDIHGIYTAIGSELNVGTTFTWKGIDDGDYKLVETTVPAGYNKMEDILFSISAEHSELAADPTLANLDGGLMGVGVVSTGTIEKDIINNTGTVLPETGAEGTFLLICGSATLIIVAAVFMITRKKMSVYED